MKLNKMLGLGLLLASTYVYAAPGNPSITACDPSDLPYNAGGGHIPNANTGTASLQCINFSSGVIQTPTDAGTLLSHEGVLASRVTDLERKLKASDERLKALEKHLGL